MSFQSTYQIKVEWGDCDPADIVFYPNYFRWFDNAAQQMFRQAKLDWSDLFERYGVVGMPLVDAGARFISPSKFGDDLTIESHVAEWHSKVLVMRHNVFNDGQLAVEGTEKRVWAGKHPDDPKRLQALVIPDEIKQALS